MKNKLSFLIFIFIAFLILANLFVSNHLATSGEEIKALELKIEELRLENSSLEKEIARSGSISAVIKRVEALGFVPSPSVFYLKREVPVAMR